MKRGRKFVIETAKNGQPYFKLVASNGQVMLVSETYSSMNELKDTLETLKGITLPNKVIEI